MMSFQTDSEKIIDNESEKYSEKSNLIVETPITFTMNRDSQSTKEIEKNEGQKTNSNEVGPVLFRPQGNEKKGGNNIYLIIGIVIGIIAIIAIVVLAIFLIRKKKNGSENEIDDQTSTKIVNENSSQTFSFQEAAINEKQDDYDLNFWL